MSESAARQENGEVMNKTALTRPLAVLAVVGLLARRVR